MTLPIFPAAECRSLYADRVLLARELVGVGLPVREIARRCGWSIRSARRVRQKLCTQAATREVNRNVAVDSVQMFRTPTMDDALAVVARYYRLYPTDITSTRRTKEIVAARWMFWAVCRSFDGGPVAYQSIAYIGGWSHSSVMFGASETLKRIETDADLAREYREVMAGVRDRCWTGSDEAGQEAA